MHGTEKSKLESAVELTPELEERALFNMLEDMQDDKVSLEQQRLATFNILDDINKTQEELKRKYDELDVIKDLTQKMGTSLELKTVMENIVNAIKKLFPSITIAYIIAPIGSKEISNIIYVHSSFGVNKDYLERIKENLLLGLETMPGLEAEQMDIKRWRAKKFYFEMGSAGKDKKASLLPTSMVNVPIVVPGTIAGIFNLSSRSADIFNKKELDIIYTIIASAGQTIERLKTLVASEHSRLQDLVESMSNAILMLDSNKQVVVANPEMRKISGVSNKKASFSEFINGIYRYPENLLIERHPTDLEEAVNRVFNEDSKIVHIAEMQIGRNFFEAFVTPVRDWQEKTSGGALILHDITHLKEVDRMKTEFVSIASHQLRTPLTAIKLFVEMLLRGNAGRISAKQKEYLGDVSESTERMIRLVNDLLNVSRLETGRLRIEPEETDIEEFIEEIIADTKPLIAQEKIKVIFNKPKTKLGLIAIDKSLMRQVVHNLLTNAIKYSFANIATSKSKQIVAALSVDDKQNYIVSVKDSGIGIPKDIQPRIFEKFFRADNAKKAETDGSGLGMYVAKMVMESSGGKIWFESEEGKGSTFYISIPSKGMKKQEGERGIAG